MDYKREKFDAEREIEIIERCKIYNDKIERKILKLRELFAEMPQELQNCYCGVRDYQTNLDAMLREARSVGFQIGYELPYLKKSFKKNFQ